MRLVADVTYSKSAIESGKAPGKELTEFDQRMVRAGFESAVGNVFFNNAILTWSFPDEEVEELREALRRLRWVVPGRDYGTQIIEDVRLVLQHFGMDNAHNTPPEEL